MLFTSNTNHLCRKMNVWALKMQGNMKKCKGMLARASWEQVQGEKVQETPGFQRIIGHHGEQILHGELKRYWKLKDDVAKT